MTLPHYGRSPRRLSSGRVYPPVSVPVFRTAAVIAS